MNLTKKDFEVMLGAMEERLVVRLDKIIDEKFDKKFEERIGKRLSTIESQIAFLIRKVAEIDARLTTLEHRVTELSLKVDKMFTILSERIDRIEYDMKTAN